MKTQLINREPKGNSKTAKIIKLKVQQANYDNGMSTKTVKQETVMNKFRQFIKDVKSGNY